MFCCFTEEQCIKSLSMRNMNLKMLQSQHAMYSDFNCFFFILIIDYVEIKTELQQNRGHMHFPRTDVIHPILQK